MGDVLEIGGLIKFIFMKKIIAIGVLGLLSFGVYLVWPSAEMEELGVVEEVGEVEEVKLLETIAFESAGPTDGYEDERALIPELIAVEKWHQVGGPIGEQGNFAGSMVRLWDGGYRMYWNDSPDGGVASAVSEDGLNFEAEEGLRMETLNDGIECKASHPWVVAMDDGYRMYFQSEYDCDSGGDWFRTKTAFSEDGLNFVREGVLMEASEENGLERTAHGRIVQLEDGSYRMYFTVSLIGDKGPDDILGATSVDGLEWVFDDEMTIEFAHDPAVVVIDGRIHMYVGFLADNTLHLVSDDGYNFELVSWTEFYDENGNRFDSIWDVEAFQTEDGNVYIYAAGEVGGSGPTQGQIIFGEE